MLNTAINYPRKEIKSSLSPHKLTTNPRKSLSSSSSSTMVKAPPKITGRKTRRRRKIPQKQNHKDAENLLLGFKMGNTTIQPSSNHLHLFHQTTIPNSTPLISDQNTVTPPPLIKKRSYCCSSSSASYSSSTYGTCSSSSPPISPSSLSSPLPSSHFSLLRCNSTSRTPSANTNTNNQPLFLRRTVSDPPIYSSDSSNEDSSSNKRVKKILQELGASPSQPVHRNAMGLLLPPLPPPPSPKLLRRTVSDPVTLSPGSSNPKGNNEKEKRQEQLVKTEKLSGDWTMIKLKCGCGSHFQFLFCAADSKCYKLV